MLLSSIGRPERWPPLLVAVALAAAGCGDDASGDDAGQRIETEVVALCDSVVALHSSIIDSVNEMSSKEVDADPPERAVLLADGIDDMIALAEAAAVPTEPAALTIGLADRRERILSELRAESEQFRDSYPTVTQDQRAGAVNRVFLLGEKLMSETEPKVTAETPDELVEAARRTRSCRFVIQLPPTG